MLGWRIGIQGYSGGGRPIGIVRDESEWSESKAGGDGNSLGNILIMGIRKFKKTIFTIEKRAHSSLFCFFLIKNLAEISKFCCCFSFLLRTYIKICIWRRNEKARTEGAIIVKSQAVDLQFHPNFSSNRCSQFSFIKFYFNFYSFF